MRFWNLFLIAKTISKKAATEELEEDATQQRLSNRSKKIKKLGEEYEESDVVKKNSKGKKVTVGISGKKNIPKSNFWICEKKF